MSLSETLLATNTETPALDVLIVGGGPVGLLAASELASLGCTVRIIDLNDKPVRLTKASGISERSMEILPQAVSDSILTTSKHVQRARLHEHDGNGMAKIIGEIGMSTGRRGGKGMRSQMQWLTEEALTKHFQSLPDHLRPGRTMQVERPCELVSFKEIKDGVECEVKNISTGHVERMISKFLLGCDGGRSSVRKGLGFTFEGEATAEYFFALHATLTGYVGNDTAVDMFFSKGSDPLTPGFCFAMPMPDGGYLIIVDLEDSQQKKWKTSENDRNGLPVLKQPEAEDVAEILRKRGCGKDLAIVAGSVKWVAHFRVNSRQADHYGKGRVYLAGDACHCHSPLGGQGMNMGFNDAKNIAWKLAYAAKGTMPLRILESYENERQPIEHKILVAIETAQKAVSSRNPVVFFMRGRGQRVVPTLLNFALEHTDSNIMQYGTQQAWTYAASSLSFEHWERPRPSFPNFLPGVWARKNQNIYRWVASRVHAGDSVPDATVGSTSIQAVLKRSRGWTLLLFEGSAAENDIMAKFVPNVKIFTVDELQSIGESLKTSADTTGYVGGIDEVIVVPSNGEAQETFKVKAQCLYLIRPDHHVALRSEPLRRDAVLKYFHQQCGMKVPEYSVPVSSTRHDPLPLTVYATLFAGTFLSTASTDFKSTRLNVFLGVVTCVLCFLTYASRAPRP
mmetsp:Transcript_49860/g.77917  ORF Transcript_49860/g.77917 Transcript_49860/m.77917 type:complete len:679 (-) Transcript_49860:231-2267(-)